MMEASLVGHYVLVTLREPIFVLPGSLSDVGADPRARALDGTLDLVSPTQIMVSIEQTIGDEAEQQTIIVERSNVLAIADLGEEDGGELDEDEDDDEVVLSSVGEDR